MKAVIVEDEESSRLTLQAMVEEFCEGVTIVGMAKSVVKAVPLIANQQPDFIFLDIEMPGKNGFQLFDYFPEPNFEVIFTTAYGEHALKAIKLSAVDYLLKPIDIEELRQALDKVKQKKGASMSAGKLQILRSNLDHSLGKLALPTAEGFSFVEMKQIIRCEANGNYTLFYLEGGEKILVSRTLKIYADLLEEFNFFRISRSQLINLVHIEKFGRQKQPTITMNDGSILSLSLSRKEEFLKRFENML